MEDATKQELRRRIDAAALKQDMANKGLLSTEEIAQLAAEKAKLKAEIEGCSVTYFPQATIVLIISSSAAASGDGKGTGMEPNFSVYYTIRANTPYLSPY